LKSSSWWWSTIFITLAPGPFTFRRVSSLSLSDLLMIRALVYFIFPRCWLLNFLGSKNQLILVFKYLLFFLIIKLFSRILDFLLFSICNIFLFKLLSRQFFTRLSLAFEREKSSWLRLLVTNIINV